jgi:hypothetical protein
VKKVRCQTRATGTQHCGKNTACVLEYASKVRQDPSVTPPGIDAGDASGNEKKLCKNALQNAQKSVF